VLDLIGWGSFSNVKLDFMAILGEKVGVGGDSFGMDSVDLGGWEVKIAVLR
tara:strand:+ start:19 stop:171 length:153 start_codon:yes stop_codon:yes gene_type:complete